MPHEPGRGYFFSMRYPSPWILFIYSFLHPLPHLVVTNTMATTMATTSRTLQLLQAIDTAIDSTATQGMSTVQLQKIPAPPTFTSKEEERVYLKGRLALAFRIFGTLGFDEGVAGHITLRDPILRDHFWVKPLGRAFGLMRSSALILVNCAGEVVGRGTNRLLNRAAYMIHHAVHVARPDVNCAAHSHSLYGRAWAALGRKVDMLTQDSCAFYYHQSVYGQLKGIVLAKKKVKRLHRHWTTTRFALCRTMGF